MNFSKLTVRQILKLYLMYLYILTKLILGFKIKVYHLTTVENSVSIISDGIDITKTNPKNENGLGFYTSPFSRPQY